MKKILIIAAAVLAFAGCAKEASQVERVTIDGKEYMTFKVVAKDDVISADTKATLTRTGVFGWSDAEPIYFVAAGGTMATGSYNASAGTITVESGDWMFASNAPFDSDSKIKDFGMAKGPVVISKVEGSTLEFHHIGSVINVKFNSIPIDGYLEFWAEGGIKWAGGEFDFSGSTPELMGGGTDEMYIKWPITTADAGKDITISVPNVNYTSGFGVGLSGTSARYFQKITSKSFDLSTRPTLLNMQQLTMPTYTVAGEESGSIAGVFGTKWDVENTANDMVLGEDGLFRKTYTHVTDYMEFKVVQNHAWGTEWPMGDNYKKDISKVTGGVNIVFNFEKNTISVEEFDIYTVVGQTELCGTSWGNTWTETYVNDMEETTAGSGVFYKQLTGIDPGTYSFKVVKNHSWGVDNEWGADGDNYVFTTSGGNVDIYFTPSIPLIYVEGFSRDDYRIAGREAEIFGTAWDANNDNNIMTPVGDGTYTKSYVIDNEKFNDWYNIEFKVTREGSWWSPGENTVKSVINGKTLTINYNPTKVEITASVE